MKTICKPKIIHQPDATPGTPYNVQLWHSYDDGETFTYSGHGRFCASIEEAISYADQHKENLAYDLGFGCKGNGTTVWNRARMDGGDYQTVAHIDPCGAYWLYVDKLPEYARREIIDHARRQAEEARADFLKLPHAHALQIVMDNMNARQWDEYMSDKGSFYDWTNEQLWDAYVKIVCGRGYTAVEE